MPRTASKLSTDEGSGSVRDVGGIDTGPDQSRTRGRTIVLGLEHFIDKIGYQAAEYRQRGIDVLYLVLDRSGLSRAKAHEYGARVEVVPSSLPKRIRFTISQFRRERPLFCELYDIGRLTLLYAIIAKAFRARLIMILRGNELRPANRELRQGGLRLALRLCDQVIAKELNIIRDLRRIGIDEAKVVFLGNCVPLPKDESTPRVQREIDILFLNSVRRMRNPELLVRCLPEVLRAAPVRRVVIAGFTHLDGTTYRIEEETESEVLELIDSLGLRDRIEVAGFVRDPEAYYRNAKVFVLPADIVFANYSLLEAMSFGVAPVVGDGEGAERIVRSGENGLIVRRTVEDLAAGLISLLNDPPRIEAYGERARTTIQSSFSIESWADRMEHVRAGLLRG